MVWSATGFSPVGDLVGTAQLDALTLDGHTPPKVVILS